MTETWDEQLSRVRGMADGLPTWDLSPNDMAAITAVLKRLDELNELVATFLHRRKCWNCGNIHFHASDIVPGVLCPECGSQDTRRVKQ